MANRHELPGFDGGTAFGGALRFFGSDDAWMTRWGRSYGDLAPNLRPIASDAFGTMYGLDESEKVAIFSGSARCCKESVWLSQYLRKCK